MIQDEQILALLGIGFSLLGTYLMVRNSLSLEPEQILKCYPTMVSIKPSYENIKMITKQKIDQWLGLFSLSLSIVMQVLQLQIKKIIFKDLLVNIIIFTILLFTILYFILTPKIINKYAKCAWEKFEEKE